MRVNKNWIFIFLVLSLWYVAQGFAEAPRKEELVLTTYYPVPYGDYKKMIIYDELQIGSADNPATAVNINARSVKVTADETLLTTHLGIVGDTSITGNTSVTGDVNINGTLGVGQRIIARGGITVCGLVPAN